MDAAAYGLIGVGVGGLVSFGVQYQALSRAEARSVRAAARVLGSELRVTDRQLRDSETSGRWQLHSADLSDAAWKEQREKLASALSRNDWVIVDDAYVRRATVAARYSLRARNGKAEPAFMDDDATLAGDARLAVEQAVAALDKLSGAFPIINQVIRRASAR